MLAVSLVAELQCQDFLKNSFLDCFLKKKKLETVGSRSILYPCQFVSFLGTEGWDTYGFLNCGKYGLMFARDITGLLFKRCYLKSLSIYEYSHLYV